MKLTEKFELYIQCQLCSNFFSRNKYRIICDLINLIQLHLLIIINYLEHIDGCKVVSQRDNDIDETKITNEKYSK